MRILLEVEPFETVVMPGREALAGEVGTTMPPINLSNPDFVRWVQSALNQLISAGLAVDGIVGPITRNAVRVFQQQQGLTVDGIVGPQTAGRIQQLLSGVLPSPQQPQTPPVTADRWTLPDDVRAVGEAQTIRYDGAGPWIGPSGCAREHTPGAKELGAYIQRDFPGVGNIAWQLVCRQNTANTSQTSIHGVGRALDISIPMISGRANSSVGDPIANWLVKNASAIGIQYIIWNRTAWNGSKSPPKHGSYGSPHSSHRSYPRRIE
jgi:hypothetical protein